MDIVLGSHQPLGKVSLKKWKISTSSVFLKVTVKISEGLKNNCTHNNALQTPMGHVVLITTRQSILIFFENPWSWASSNSGRILVIGGF